MPEKSEPPSGKYVWGGAAACLVLLVALCAKPDPTPSEKLEPTECGAECEEWIATQR